MRVMHTVHPGTIQTDMSGQGDVAEYVKELEKDIPLKRMGEIEEISKLVLFLASDDSSYSNGAQFVADGGMVADI